MQPDNEFDVFVFDDLMGWLRGNYSQAQELTSKHISTLRKEGAIEVCTLVDDALNDETCRDALDAKLRHLRCSNEVVCETSNVYAIVLCEVALHFDALLNALKVGV